MSFPRYPTYKDSGAEWLGEVPTHWAVTTFYGSVVERSEPNKGMCEDNLLSLSYGRIVRKDITSNDGLLPESFETYQIVRPGDIVLRLTDLQNDKRSLRSALVEETGIITSAYLAVTPRGASSKFVSYLFRAYDTSRVFYSMGGGLRQSMKFADLKRMPMLRPPPLEQTQIAAFLDRETAKIDALVAEQRRLMDLLKEKRQSVISHAVTKGLNPDAAMKPSGVEWLGDVPEHWEIKSIRYVLDAIGDVDHFMPESVEKGVPYLMTGDLKDFVSDVSLVDCKQVSHDDYLALSKKIKNSKGDVIVARYATIGTSMYVDMDVDFLVSYSCVTLKPNRSQISGLYLFQYLKSDAFRQGVENQTNTNTQSNVGIKDLQNVKIAVPPINEQTAIATFLDSETTKFDTLITEAQRAIDLLQERRSALISAAVTGQIDVRELVARQEEALQDND